ncbi:MAG TPA: tetratricopeptide repeat protein, partial [Chryseolinea sp.]|nr:tetratricopeptide repeat protein [Chryseolinea sp.]
MTLWIRRLFTVIILASLQYNAFSQGTDSARSLYLSGESLIKKNPAEAFQLLARAMTSARRHEQWPIYLVSVNSLALLDTDDQLRHSRSSTKISIDLKRQEEKVFTWLKEAVEILKNANEDSILAQLHYTTGEYYYKLRNEIDQPIFHYQKAKKIWTILKGEWSEEVSNCYHGLGNIYKYYKFDFYEAEKCYEKALLIREKIGFNNLDALYKNYYSLATTNRSQNDFEKALSYGTKALELAKQFDMKGLGPLRTEMSSGMLANIYRDMNQSSLAKKYYLTALELNKKTKDLATRAWYYNSLGETFKNDSAFNEATEYFEKAYSIYKIPGEIKQQSLRINLLNKMVETYSLMGDEKNFLRLKRETLTLLDSLDMSESSEASQLWLLIGGHQQHNRSYDSALFCFQKSLVTGVPAFTSMNFQDNPTEEMIGFRYRINETLIKKASAFKDKFLNTGDALWLSQSLASLRLAEKLLSRQRNTLDMEDAKWKFLESKYDLYEDILSSLYQGIDKLPLDTVNSL